MVDALHGQVQAPTSSTEAAKHPAALATGRPIARLARLTLKELRETLRDRRTILTLVLMPLLLYPLLSIGFRQLFLSHFNKAVAPSYVIGVTSKEERRHLTQFVRLPPPPYLAQSPAPLSPADPTRPAPRAAFNVVVVPDLEVALRTYQIDVGVRVRFSQQPDGAPRQIAVDLELVHLEGNLLVQQAIDALQRHLTLVNNDVLTFRLRQAGIQQRASAYRTVLVPLSNPEAKSSDWLTTLVPLILILMTITGAVYPAIDLTAGERERGTLEILVAAPVPRLSLLLAKYFAVLSVALLTACINLATMTTTVLIGGLGNQLFGEAGLTPTVVCSVLALLLLFATFFSAVVLALTSFARSFKEAQAYLIPLMMVSIAPGLLSFVPGLKLSGALAITPLVNVVLLGRDLFTQQVDVTAAVVVVVSTLLYAVAAIAVAARFFAAEAVLYSTESGWSDLFRRPTAPRSTPSLPAAMLSLALLFPAFFVAIHLVSQIDRASLSARLAGGALATILVFAGLPILSCHLGRVWLRSGLRLRPAAWLSYPAALLLGLGVWAFAHELLVLQFRVGLIDSEKFGQAQQLASALRQLPPALVLICLAVVPAVCEELFFRGYLLSALAAKSRPAAAILTSAILFGLFHVFTPGGIAFERLLSSTLIGVVLGWVAWRTGSVWPGILMHATNNGLLLIVTLYQEWIEGRGWGLGGNTDLSSAHLPVPWLLTAAGLTGLSALLAYLGTRKEKPTGIVAAE